MYQVADYISKNLFAGEAHLHALANLKQLTIITIQPSKEKVIVYAYEPGWKPQKACTRQQVRDIAKRVPAPIFMHLNAKSTHFSAYVSAALAKPRGSKRKQLGKGSSSAVAIALE